VFGLPTAYQQRKTLKINYLKSYGPQRKIYEPLYVGFGQSHYDNWAGSINFSAINTRIITFIAEVKLLEHLAASTEWGNMAMIVDPEVKTISELP
jgi:hypothetical protein